MDFLTADGIFPLAIGETTAVAIPFRLSKSLICPNEVHDQTPTRLDVWTQEMEALAAQHGQELGASILCQFDPEPKSQPTGGSLGLALVLARERLRGRVMKEFLPMEVLATGAFRNGRLIEVDHLPAKKDLAARLGCALFVFPTRKPASPIGDLALDLSIEEAMKDWR